MRCNNQLFFFKVQDNEHLAYNNDSSGWKILIHDQKEFAADSSPHTRHNALSWMVQRYSRFHTTGTP